MRIALLLTITSLLLISNICAQVTITQSDMPQVGETYAYVEVPGLDVEDPESEFGEDAFWNYSDLPDGMATQVTYLAVSDVPLQLQLIFNNPFAESYANLALPVDDFGGFDQIPVSDAHQFFRADEDGFFDCGYAALFSDFPVFGNRNPTDRIFPFPLEYGLEPDENDSFFEINIPELANIKSWQTRENTYDAWGTVITPAGEYDAVRVRSVVNRTDSVVIPSFGIDQVFVSPETVEYRWVAPGEGIPVLQINTVEGAVTQVVYKSDEVDTGLLPQLESEELSIYPNPAQTITTVEISATEVVKSVAMIDLNGRSFQPEFQRVGNHVELNVESMAAGMYRVVVTSESQRFSGWVMVKK